jgi:transposase
MKTKSWEVSDKFWAIVEPLIPKPERSGNKVYKRKVGGGRKPITPRVVFSAIVYVLRTGIQWKAIPKENFGSASAIHRYFREWEQKGFFLELWKRGLAEYDDMEGIAWEWQSIDGSMYKAPLARESSGPNPTDRGKKRKQTACIGGGAWSPSVSCRNRRKQA